MEMQMKKSNSKIDGGERERVKQKKRQGSRHSDNLDYAETDSYNWAHSTVTSIHHAILH